MANGANAAILYRPEGFETTGPRLMGRQAAGEGFLKGFVQHADVDRLYCYTPRREQAEHFQAAVKGNGNTRPVQWLNELDPNSPAQAGTLYLPDPSISLHAWRRRHLDQRGYSIVGVTHTTASAGAMDWISGLQLSPAQEWDALICTSTVVKQTVDFVLDAQAEFLGARFGATWFPRPQLPIIPLGIDTARFTPDEAARAQSRAALNIGADDIVVLFVGRLSFHAKAHPLPMYLGLERVARAMPGRKIHLLQAGWFANDFIGNAFKTGAATFCPSVHCGFVDGRNAEARHQAWAAADIFTSLSDNIQETYGLAPVEAMAAGLPSVVTDWNGYRDTIRDGIDGIRVPTIMPPPGWAEDLADRHAHQIDNYDHYCGFTSQFVAVDPEACAAAYMRLAGDPALRRQMGAAARERAVARFDWRVVIDQYQQLWAELAERRRSAPESVPRKAGQPVQPTRADPYQAFAGYATATLGANDMIELAPGATAAVFDGVTGSSLIAFAKAVNPPAAEMHRTLERLKDGGRTVAELAQEWPEDTRTVRSRSLLWLAKMGLVRIRKN
ncbi:glycosyltransferase family 4 protein [Dongia sedimenti]|uniref:Glycosyltransferase family 4 protein n=1 Tax=Dongia sedimenti TaxID=3064282 RepID=A0ABU0YIF6_9PROT|nr:glycosyltransferase family 4 protein [Rhodospirillaceae bacterium R-7]